MPGLGSDSAHEISFAPGDMLMLVTDGFFEWENPEGEQFGLDRLHETIRRSKDLSAKEIISKLHSAVLEFANGTEQQDDLTAVIVKRETGVARENDR
jgi:serine phosphatase RsbU (regulator of sigma subunit)